MKPNEHINRQNKLFTIIVHETYNYKFWRNSLKTYDVLHFSD